MIIGECSLYFLMVLNVLLAFIFGYLIGTHGKDRKRCGRVIGKQP